MNKTVAFYSRLIVLVFLLFTIGNTYSQSKKPTDNTLFGKSIKKSSIHPTSGKIRCATTEYEQFLQEKNPNRMSNAQFENWLAPLVSKQKVARATAKTTAPIIITIPVVVHVIHSGQPVGTAPNIVDAQVQSQISVLNQDFRRMMGTPGFNTSSVGADAEIEFVLAKQDPNGQPTNGIDRVNMTQKSWTVEDIDGIVKPSTIWDPSQYLNMWTVKYTKNDLLGYAQFPNSSTLRGLEVFEGDANTDGVVSGYDVFGSKAFGSGFLLAKSYDGGRTMTHEVGHFLGLKHIWGDGEGTPPDPNTNPPKSGVPDCSATDHCADTPQAGYQHYDCEAVYNSCPANAGNDMVENYMDYTSDACMNIFTLDQKDRMATVLANSPRRASLKTSTKGNSIPLFAIDAEIKVLKDYSIINATSCASLAAPSNKQVLLTNRGTSSLTSASITYAVNGAALQTQNWTGSLAQNEFAIVTLLNSASNGLLSVNITTANGTTDQRTSNNVDIKAFSPVNYSYSKYVFTLQQDFYGSETTWELLNGSGTIIDKGGPYKSDNSETLPLPVVITKNWILPVNQCYTFKIYDNEGDGICCGGGNGYYNIKTSDGTITLQSGSSFGQKEVTFFTNDTLNTNSFELLNSIYLFPNPSKLTLNIHIPNTFGLPNSYAISNSLGQIISRKEVSKEADLALNTSSLSNGVYFITVTKEDQSRTLQFIKE